MDCETCKRAQEAGSRTLRCGGIDAVDECPTGEVPKLLARNRRFWWWFQRAFPALFDGMGGISLSGLAEAMEIYGVPAGQRPVAYEMCLVMVGVIREARERETKK